MCKVFTFYAGIPFALLLHIHANENDSSSNFFINLFDCQENIIKLRRITQDLNLTKHNNLMDTLILAFLFSLFLFLSSIFSIIKHSNPSLCFLVLNFLTNYWV